MAGCKLAVAGRSPARPTETAGNGRARLRSLRGAPAGALLEVEPPPGGGGRRQRHCALRRLRLAVRARPRVAGVAGGGGAASRAHPGAPAPRPRLTGARASRRVPAAKGTAPDAEGSSGHAGPRRAPDPMRTRFLPLERLDQRDERAWRGLAERSAERQPLLRAGVRPARRASPRPARGRAPRGRGGLRVGGLHPGEPAVTKLQVPVLAGLAHALLVPRDPARGGGCRARATRVCSRGAQRGASPA